jgi:hypothetical protein
MVPGTGTGSYQRASRVKKVEYFNGLYAIMSLKNGSQHRFSVPQFRNLLRSTENRSLGTENSSEDRMELLAAKNPDRLHGGNADRVDGAGRRRLAAAHAHLWPAHSPIIAVGSDAMCNFFTKIPATIMHFQRDSAAQSRAGHGGRQYPGSFLGVRLLVHLRESTAPA